MVLITSSVYLLCAAAAAALISTVFFSVAVRNSSNQESDVKEIGLLIVRNTTTDSVLLAWYGINGRYLKGVTAFQPYQTSCHSGPCTDCTNLGNYVCNCQTAAETFSTSNIFAALFSAMSSVSTYARFAFYPHSPPTQHFAIATAFLSALLGVGSFGNFNDKCANAIRGATLLTVDIGAAMALTLIAFVLQFAVAGINYKVSTDEPIVAEPPQPVVVETPRGTPLQEEDTHLPVSVADTNLPVAVAVSLAALPIAVEIHMPVGQRLISSI